MWNSFYLFRPPWDAGTPQKWLVELVDNGRLKPCKTIDLGCGMGTDTIYLAKKGFNITGVDISTRAINKARQNANDAKINVNFIVGDVTDLKQITEKFDLVVDDGCLHSIISQTAREKYVQTILKLTKYGSKYFLKCFVKSPKRIHNPIRSIIRLDMDEVEQRFGKYFSIEIIRKPFPGMVTYVYLLTRKR